MMIRQQNVTKIGPIMTNIGQIIDNIKIFSGAKSDRQVAKLLQMEPPALFNHKKRGTIPFKKVTTYCYQNNLALDSVMGAPDGIGPTVKAEPSQGHQESKEGLNQTEEGRMDLLDKLVKTQGKYIEKLEGENKLLQDELDTLRADTSKKAHAQA
jgi:hypothetical protein